MRFTKTRKSDWYKQPTMVGHERCKDTIYLAEEIITKYAKTKRTKALANYVIRDIPRVALLEQHFQEGIEYASFRIA